MHTNGENMAAKMKQRDEMRSHYDFSGGVRGQLDWILPRCGYIECEKAAADTLIDKLTKRWPDLSRYSAETAVERCLAIVKHEGQSDRAFDAVKVVIKGLDTSIRDCTVFLPIV